MTHYETLRGSMRPFGSNGYLEVSRRRITTRDGVASEYVLVTRGYLADDGTKRWTRFVTLPADAELRAWLADALRDA